MRKKVETLTLFVSGRSNKHFRGVFRTQSNGQKLLTVSAKSFILDVWLGSEYASEVFIFA